MRIPDTDGLAEHLAYLRLRDLASTHVHARRRAVERLAVRLDRDASTATTEEIRDYLSRLPRTTARSRYAEHSHLSCFFTWAAETHERPNPMRTIPRPKLTRLLPRPMSEEDTHVAIDNAPARIRVCLVLAAYQGLRACEIAALDRSDILDTAPTPVLIAHGKGRKDRVIPLGERALAELRAFGVPSRGPLLRREDGQTGGISAHRVSSMCNAYLHDMGISDTLHQLRHRFATRTYAATQDVLVVAALLGHEDPATTAGYAAYSNAATVAAVRALDIGPPYRSAAAGYSAEEAPPTVSRHRLPVACNCA